MLLSWEGTKYMAGCQAKGALGGVDCVRFVTGVYDELYRTEKTKTARLPQDVSLHNKNTAMKTMRAIRRLFMPNVIVTDNTIEPGDSVVVGPWGGGPGHCLIAGFRPNTLWEAAFGGVRDIGLSTKQRIFRVYRQTDKHLWL